MPALLVAHHVSHQFLGVSGFLKQLRVRIVCHVKRCDRLRSFRVAPKTVVEIVPKMGITVAEAWYHKRIDYRCGCITLGYCRLKMILYMSH